MLKQRIVGVIVVLGGRAVQSFGFARHLPIGRPEIAVEYLNRWGIDEIVLLGIDTTRIGADPDYKLVAACTPFCQVPLAVGGGVRSLRHMEQLISAGADKVVLNSALADNPGLLISGSRHFGSQAMVASIDAVCTPGGYVVMTHGGRRSTGITPAEFAQQCEDLGVGEILLNSVDRDGSKEGYDMALLDQVRQAVDIPVVACGGVGHPAHLLEGLRSGVSGVAAANFFHFVEHSVMLSKRYLLQQGHEVRLDTYTNYEHVAFDDDGRLARADEDRLTSLRFMYIPEEVL